MSTELKVMLPSDTVILSASNGVQYTVKDFLKVAELAEQLLNEEMLLSKEEEQMIIDLGLSSSYVLSNDESYESARNDFVSTYSDYQFKNSRGENKYIVSKKWILEGRDRGYGDCDIELKLEEPANFSYLKHILDESGVDFPDTAYNHFMKLATIHNEEDGDHYGSFYKKAFYVIDLEKLYDEIQKYNMENGMSYGVKP